MRSPNTVSRSGWAFLVMRGEISAWLVKVTARGGIITETISGNCCPKRTTGEVED